MTSQDVVLFAHIACGTAGLILGPTAMWARKLPGLHTQAGEIYHWIMLGVGVTAAALAFLDWSRLWWFLPIAAGSYAFALLGYLAAKLRWNNWLRFHLAGQGGSYIAMVTALLVVNTSIQTWWAWILPTLVGSPLIAWISIEVAAGRRPRY